METAVWDTYVTKKSGEVMHFDIVVPSEMKDKEKIFGYGREYLKSKNEEGPPITSNESKFCHVEGAKPQAVTGIKEKGYHIVEMEGC